MPNGDLASVVLEAAKKERGLLNDDGPKRAQDPNTAAGSHQDAKNPNHIMNGHSHKPGNGHLAPPFEWNGPNRAVSASPEPMEDDTTHNANRPAKKDSPAKQSPQNSRKLSSSFRSNSGRRTSTASRERRIYTSQSSNDIDDDAHDHTGQKQARGLDQETGQQVSASVGQAGTSQPLRGPFSRIDSARGQNSLSSSRNGSGSSKQNADAARRKSTGGTDSRRPSMTMSATARKFVGFFTDGEQDDETQDEPGPSDDECRNRRLHPPTIQETASREGHTSNATSDHGTPSRRVTSRANSYGFGRSQRSSRRNSMTEAEQGEDSDHPNGASGARPPMARGQTKARMKWDALRQRIKQDKKPTELDKGLTGSELVTDLSAGMMSVMMLKMAFDRDEHDKHRIPVLLNYLKLRITDSIYPFNDKHAIFRIELEYGDGLLKWVVYRELRDFVNLHTHYKVANVTHALDNFPAFPKVSLPYFNLLKKESREKGGSVPGKAEFAKLQRESLENYVLRLVRAVMFRPEANRLCKFLELSAMSIHLATRGGTQGKQGYLRVLSSGASRHKRPGFHPIDLKRRHEPKWFIIRESYIVAVDEVFGTQIWDVFLLDSDFKIERPNRLYRQGIGLFAGDRQKSHGKDNREDEDLPGETQPLAGFEGIRGGNIGDPNDPSTTSDAKEDPQHLKNTSAHTFYIRNSERKIKLVAKSERQMDQFIASIEKMTQRSIWAGKNRFGSFSPIRMNVAAQWLVDGRDYYWNLSRAILLAKHSVYIHDWWLSPELYLRRPPGENGRWRLDRLLQKKAEEGVHIYVIIYNEVSNDFTPVDSQYTKHTLMNLHPNIMVQRSPNHAQTRTLLWSHHEKMCVVDETIAFMGGLDLCFGRWDTPGHSMLDDGPAVKDDLDRSRDDVSQNSQEGGQIWPGKDYSNSRVSDFFTLNKPFEDMYDRRKTPREPWHDIGLQIIGQPARDLCRHFVQRWNLLLRSKNHRRFMPFLLPPPDFTAKELEHLQLAGTCEAQICRSAGPWSIGTPNKTEHSIQTAYIKAIQLSDHFVYIENQFFITSTEVVGTTVENNIGNALVARIQQAHAEGTPWRAIIVMPLEPGYAMPVDHPDAGSVRLIMECQFNSISRGEHSIFARLRRDGIDPNEYISFYGLRNWARMQDGTLSTTGIYIHAKCMVVDDRLVIIGSANLNERSQRGDRDSELACVIRDTDMIDSTMAGKPYKVGRFAHTLRVRLMREHLGVDVDAMEEEETNMDLLDRDPIEDSQNLEAWDPHDEEEIGNTAITKGKAHRTRAGETAYAAASEIKKGAKGAVEAVGFGADQAIPNINEDAARAANPNPEASHNRKTRSNIQANQASEDNANVENTGEGFASTVVPTLEEKALAEGRPPDDMQDGHSEHGQGNGPARGHLHKPEEHAGSKRDMDNLDRTRRNETSMQSEKAQDTRQLRHDGDTPEGLPEDSSAARSADSDRLEPGYRGRTKHSRALSAESTTSVATQTSRVTSETAGGSKQGKTNEQIANSNKATDSIKKHLNGKMNAYSLPTKAPKIDPKMFADPLIDNFYKNMWMAAAVRNTQIYRKVFRCTPDDLVTTWSMLKEWSTWNKRHETPPTGAASAVPSSVNGDPEDSPKERSHLKSGSDATLLQSSNGNGSTINGKEDTSDKKKHKNHQSASEPFTEEEIEQMIELLEETTGHLVLFSTRFLEGESMGQNFLWSKDRIPPIAIYN